MEKPVDRVYYAQALFNGKTSEQIFLENVSAGKIVFVGKVLYLDEEIEYLEVLRLGGKPRKWRLVSVSLFEADLYKDTDGKIQYRRDRVLKQKWTASEWTPEVERQTRSLIKKSEETIDGHSSSGRRNQGNAGRA